MKEHSLERSSHQRAREVSTTRGTCRVCNRCDAELNPAGVCADAVACFEAYQMTDRGKG